MSVTDRKWLLNRIEEALRKVCCPMQTTMENMEIMETQLMEIMELADQKRDMIAKKIELKIAKEREVGR